MSPVGRTRVLKQHFIIATGARPRVLPNLPIDGKMIIDPEARMTMVQPRRWLLENKKRLSGVCVFLYFTIGTKLL